jgi:archaetidylinositol phosphate synthase
MLEKRYRNIYQSLCVNPILNIIGNKVSPIYITILSGVVGVLVIPALYFDVRILAICLILLSGYLDTLDGSVARHNDATSDTGSVLDIFTDRIVEGAIIIGLFLVDQHRGFICLLMLFAILLCITAFLVVGVFTTNGSQKSFFYSNGLIERAEAFIFFILMIILPGYFTILGIIFVILVLITAFLHLWLFYKYSSKS